MEKDLVEKTAAKIEALGIEPEIQADDPEVVDDSTSDDDSQTDDSTKDDDSTPEKKDDKVSDDDNEIQADDPEVVDDSTSDDDSQTDDSTKEDDSTPKKVELPDAYYRAAIHQEWKPEEISKFLESNPELAKRTFAKIYESTNKLSMQYANLGKTQLKQQQKESQEQAPEFKGVDIDKLKKDYGDDEPLIDVVGQMQEQNKLLFQQIQNQQQQVQQQQTQAANSNVQIIEQQVDTFFVNDDLKLYNDFYGAGKDSGGKVVQPDALTPGQKANRYAVLELADQIRAGSALQGREMPIPEALELAHLNITAPIREQKIREDIIAKVVKREKGITLKGSGKKQTMETGPLKGAALESKTAQAIKALLNK